MRPDPREPPTAVGTVLARLGRNVAWLVGGKGFLGVASLLYLAIAARALGPHGFGAFTLVLAYGQAIANLCQFQTWQSVIRYGAIHMAAGDSPRLRRLLGFTATLDVASALAGAAIAACGVVLAGPLLGWTSEEQQRAALFGGVLLLSIGATPTGMLRLFDRFDLLTYCQSTGPLARLLGSVIAWALGGGVSAFLLVWVIAALLESGAGWATALTRAKGGITLGRAAMREAPRDNPGIWRFMLVTNASSALGEFVDQFSTLAVGGLAGATQAGGFRLASKIARALVKPVETVARALYPELARLIASKDHETLHGVMRRTNLIALGMAILIGLIGWLCGPALLHLVGGKAYGFAHVYLLVLAIAAAIDLSGFSLEPLLTAHGRAGAVLSIRATGAVAYGLTLALLLSPLGPLAAAIATAASQLVMRVRLGLATARLTDARAGPKAPIGR